MEGIANHVNVLLNEYIQLAQSKGVFGIGKEHGYREIVEKDKGRYDLNLDHLLRNEGTRYLQTSK